MLLKPEQNIGKEFCDSAHLSQIFALILTIIVSLKRVPVIIFPF